MSPPVSTPALNPEAQKACPFCGSEAASGIYTRHGSIVRCRNLDCGAEMAAFQPDALAKSITRWNTRPEPEALGDVVEALKPFGATALVMQGTHYDQYPDTVAAYSGLAAPLVGDFRRALAALRKAGQVNHG